MFYNVTSGFSCGSAVKNPPANAGDAGSIPGWGRSWRRKWEPTPVFLSEKSQGQRSLMGYSLRGCKRVGHIAMKQQTQWCDKWLHPWRLFPLLPAGCRNSGGVPSGTALSSLCWSLCSIFVSTLSPEALYWCPFLSWDFLDFLFYLFLVWTFILCF